MRSMGEGEDGWAGRSEKAAPLHHAASPPARIASRLRDGNMPPVCYLLPLRPLPRAGEDLNV